MNKDEKRRALAEYKRRQKEAFFASLPMPEALFRELFDHLDEQLGEADCQHDLRFTEAFLNTCGCDTDEVLANIEEQFNS